MKTISTRGIEIPQLGLGTYRVQGRTGAACTRRSRRTATRADQPASGLLNTMLR